MAARTVYISCHRNRHTLGSGSHSFLFDSLFDMNFTMSFLLITTSELAAADVTGEGFLSGVSSDVSGEMITTTERSHAYLTLEWFLPGVNSNVSC